MKNKIGFVINCVSDSFPCYFENSGLKYLRLEWTEADQEFIISLKGKTGQAILQFCSEAKQKFFGVLIHCRGNFQRSMIILMFYLCKRYFIMLFQNKLDNEGSSNEGCN